MLALATRTLPFTGNRRRARLQQSWSRRGVSSLETALLLPFLFLFFAYAIQIGFIMLSHQVTQYATYMAARANLVYGNKTLGAIQYPYTANEMGMGDQGGLLTSDEQTVAEAVAEKIIFESLPWEHERIAVANVSDWFMERAYSDGVDTGAGAVNGGAVRVEFSKDPVLHNYSGVKVTYCMPVLFPGLDLFFRGNFASNEGAPNPCNGLRDNSQGAGIQRVVMSIPIQHEFYLGREP